jgi:GH15 family glucan-1,4-alpha-glucosidase
LSSSKPSGNAKPFRGEHGVVREDGFAPISDYGTIGDGRSVALVARDGDIDWLCLPSSTSPAAFAALLDPERGGRASLAPTEPYQVQRRYVEDTNVLQATYRTASGTVRLTDAMNLDGGTPPPWSELVRRVECVAGEVPLAWSVSPRASYGRATPTVARRSGVPVLELGHADIAVHAWNAGEPVMGEQGVSGRMRLHSGETATVALTVTAGSPIAAPRRAEIERRLRWTVEDWRRVTAACVYDGPWQPAVRRSALLLHLLIDAAQGMLVAAPTTSLPERLGGDRNYDYRFGWVRDSAFALDALMHLGYRAQAHASLAWLLDATSHTHPRLQPFYRIDGDPRAPESSLSLRGYRGSRPVRIGNAAAGQLQLGAFGDLLDTVLQYVDHGNALDSGTAQRIAEIADFICKVWRDPDSSIWELPTQRHYTQSKLGCWMALDRAVRLADLGVIEGEGVPRWRREAEAIRSFVLTSCWSVRKRTLVACADSDALDASVLLAGRHGFFARDADALAATVEAVCRELRVGPCVYRCSGSRELEGAFIPCSFWLMDALARLGRHDDAAEVMDGACAASNDLGLLSEEVDPDSGELLGNFPQALSHLALANAAVTFAEAGSMS